MLKLPLLLLRTVSREKSNAKLATPRLTRELKCPCRSCTRICSGGQAFRKLPTSEREVLKRIAIDPHQSCGPPIPDGQEESSEAAPPKQGRHQCKIVRPGSPKLFRVVSCTAHHPFALLDSPPSPICLREPIRPAAPAGPSCSRSMDHRAASSTTVFHSDGARRAWSLQSLPARELYD
jgi:hypothetical protein